MGLIRFWKKMHWLGQTSLVVLVLMYLGATFAPYISPYSFYQQNRRFPYAPPTRIHFDGIRPYVYAYKPVDIHERRYQELTNGKRYYIKFFHKGRLLGLDSRKAKIFLTGADDLGRDLFTRILYGSRISLSIGFIGVFVSFFIGIVVGGVSGYCGGLVDNLIMRVCEVFMSLPTFYFLLALAVIIPPNISSAWTFALIVFMMSFIGWAGFARIVRGMILAAREMEYVEAARALGASGGRVLFRHLVPSVRNYSIIAATLSIPGYILGEASLSLIGLGIKDPDPSLGNLLSAAMKAEVIIKYPWILLPGLFIFLIVMSFQFIGDALRDYLDPRGTFRGG